MRPDVDGLNTGYAALLLEQYLDNPSAVPSEWRALFESAPEELLAVQPGLARLLELHRDATQHFVLTEPLVDPLRRELKHRRALQAEARQRDPRRRARY